MNQLACPLSLRHRAILSLEARGKDNQEIALELGSSTNTVHNQFQAIYARLGVAKRIAAVVIALREGWIKFPPKDQETFETLLQEKSHVE